MFVLYSTRREARELVREAKSLGLTRKEFVWIATQPVIIIFGFSLSLLRRLARKKEEEFVSSSILRKRKRK